MSVDKIFLWASRIFSKVTLLVSHKGKKPTLSRAPSLPIPFTTVCSPSTELPVPPEGSLGAPRSHHSHTAPWAPSQGEWDWRGALNSPYVPHSSTAPHSVSWWSGSASKLLIDSTPGSLFLVIPAGRVWCIKELQRLKLERPVVFNHLVHPPTWAGVFLMLFFPMLYLV